MIDRNLEREKKIYHRIFLPENKIIKEMFFDKLMTCLEKIKYDIIWDILEYMTIYNQKVGINSGEIKLTNIEVLIHKPFFNLREIKHKWMKLSENPNIDPGEIYKDF